MSRRRGIWLAVGGVLLAVAVVGALVFQPWLLFIDDHVDDGDDGTEVVGTATAGLTDTSVPEPSGAGQTRVELGSGEFVDAEHGTSGVATVYRRSDGSRFVLLDGLDTSNGPDLHVWITDQESGGGCGGCVGSWSNYDDGAYVRLGELRGNQGSSRYEIPADADLAGMRSVVIWCDRFNVAFGTAAIA